MIRKPIILYICIDPSMGGSTASLYNLIDSVKDYVTPIVLFREEGVGVDFFRENGIESHVYPYISLYQLPKNSIFSVWKHPWRWHYIKKIRFDYGCLRFVKKILAGRKIDIVHTNTSPNDIGIFLARKLKAKHVWHVREFCDLHFNFEIYGGLTRLRSLINESDARIAISSAIKEHWRMPDLNTFVINDAVRSRNETCYIETKEKYLLFSSYYLTEAKGTRRAIQAFAQSGVGKQGFRLKLIGNCAEDFHQSLLQTAKELRVENAIDFIPCQKEVKPYFAKATAYIMASEFEGLGRVTAEAMFYGCPVIAHATGGTLDIVKDRETGYLFKTIEECAQFIRKVCTEPQEALILRAHKFAVDNLSQEVYGPKIMEVYNKVLNKKEMIDTSALIKGANLSINIFAKRLVEDIALNREIPQDGCRELHVALHLRMAVLFSLLELSTIEKAILVTKHTFAKRYHYKNLVANTSECYKLLYHFGNARKKSVWTKVYEIVKKNNNSDLLTRYQEITCQLDDFGDNNIDKQLRDITMHYSENMLTVYELTVAFNNENDAHQYYIGFNDILRSMLDFSDKLVEVYAAQYASPNGTISISSNLIGDAKLSAIRSIIDANETLLSTIDNVLPKGTQELDYFAQTESRLVKIHDYAKQNMPILEDELLSEMDIVVRMTDIHVLLRFMMLDMMSNIEALCYANSTMEAALHIRRFVIPQVSMMILLFGYEEGEQENSLWHQIETKIPQNLVTQGNAIKKILTELLSHVSKEKRNSHVHVYDDKGSNLIPSFIGAMENLDFQEELGMVLKISRFYGLLMQFMEMLMTELAKIAHRNNEQSTQELNNMIETTIQKVEDLKLPENVKQQLLEKINWIKEVAEKY